MEPAIALNLALLGRPCAANTLLFANFDRTTGSRRARELCGYARP